jgi:hypothetical protein
LADGDGAALGIESVLGDCLHRPNPTQDLMTVTRVGLDRETAQDLGGTGIVDLPQVDVAGGKRPTPASKAAAAWTGASAHLGGVQGGPAAVVDACRWGHPRRRVPMATRTARYFVTRVALKPWLRGVKLVRQRPAPPGLWPGPGAPSGCRSAARTAPRRRAGRIGPGVP